MQLTARHGKGLAHGTPAGHNGVVLIRSSIRIGVIKRGVTARGYSGTPTCSPSTTHERLRSPRYHAGQANVDEWRRKGQSIQFSETRAYVLDGRTAEGRSMRQRVTRRSGPPAVGATLSAWTGGSCVRCPRSYPFQDARRAEGPGHSARTARVEREEASVFVTALCIARR